jgi:hypothetical protein
VDEKETALDETDVLATTALAKKVDEDGHAQSSARWWRLGVPNEGVEGVDRGNHDWAGCVPSIAPVSPTPA